MVVILNAGAGPGHKAELCQQVKQMLEAAGLEATVHLAHSGQEVIALARAAVEAKEPLVVAGGGDGTLNAVASVLVGTETTLGVLPLGTLNHFAGDLGIPKDLQGAIETLKAGRAKSIDVGEVNGRIFLNNSSLGLYPEIVANRLWHQRHGLSKWPAFGLAVLRVLKRFPLLDVRLDTEQQVLAERTPFVFLGNNMYAAEGSAIGTRQCLDAGELCLYTTRATNRWSLLRLALGILVPRLREKQTLECAAVKDAWIATRRRKLRVSLDGEVAVMTSPLRYRTRPRALKALVPLEAGK